MHYYNHGKCKFLKFLSLLLCGAILFGFAPITTFAAGESENDMYITDLKVNNLIEPLGIDTVPTFRWINHMSGYARSQSAYQIIVASTAEKAAAHKGDVWDSGKVGSNLNYDIAYGGDALASRTAYFYAVQVWDESGNSVWSEVSTFETGVFADSEWTANWIGITDGDTAPCNIDLSGANWIWFKDGAAAPVAGTDYFRVHFNIDKEKEVDEVILATSMDDYGYIFVNSALALAVKYKVGDWKACKVVNITPYVKKGDNIFGARIFNASYLPQNAGFIAKIEVRYTDGSVDTTVTDHTWKCSNAANTASSSGWEWASGDDTLWSAPDQSIAYGSGVWGSKVVMPETMQVNVGASAPMLRRSFVISKEIERARIYISGLGLYELYVNGKLPDDSVLNPAHTQYEDTVHYRAYDVTDMLTSGKNALAVELGNFFYNTDVGGWMRWNYAVYRDNPKLFLELHIDYADGTTETIVTDETWKTYEYGPVTENDIYFGETHDARKAVDGWANADFDDSAWRSAILVDAPAGDLTFENMEPMRRLKTFKPTVHDKGSGTYIIENPEMTTGWAKIRFNAPAGTEIRINYGEKLDEQGFVVIPINIGYVMQQDTFITSGGEDVYEPKYSYKGYQYIQIENYPGTLTADDVECYLIANDVADISEFETGDSRINLLQEMMDRTTLNNLQGKLTDTPVYEKCGWTGEVNRALEAFNYSFDFANVMQKTLIDYGDSASAKGVIAQTAPAAYSGGVSIPLWTSVFIDGYYENWRVNGITTAIAEHYDALRLQTLDYLSCIQANGWVWTTDRYADWLSPTPLETYISGKTTSAPEGAAIIGSAYVYRTLDEMAKMADLLGKSNDAAEYRAAMKNIYTVFNATFYDAELGYYDTGYWDTTYQAGRTKYRQTSNIIPLMFGLCPEKYEASVVASIVNDIKAKDNHLDVGQVGLKHLLPMLSKYGYNDVAMAIIHQDTYPSWGFMISHGATAFWETWETNTRSHSHFVFGVCSEWFYENLAGVRDFTNGYETVELRPEIIGEIGYVNCRLKTVRGELKSYWRFTEDNKLVWEITVPVGTTATVYLPAAADISAYSCITVSGDKLIVPSGNYTFTMDASGFSVDKTRLAATLENAKTFDKKDYTGETFATLTALISECEGVVSDDGATQYEVCTAQDKLENAVNGLCKNSAREALAALVSSSETYSSVNFPEFLLNQFTSILSSAKTTLSDENTSAEDIENAYAALRIASNALAKYNFGNVALGKSPLASTSVESSTWCLANLTDGNRKNMKGTEIIGWSSNGFLKTQHREWVGVDLGAVYSIDQIQIMPAGAPKGGSCAAFPRDFVLSVSEGGEIWTVVASETDYPIPTTEMQIFDFEPVNARYIRLEGITLGQRVAGDANRFRMQLGEIEAYNTSIAYSDIDLDGDADIVDALKLLRGILNKEIHASLADFLRLLKQIAK